jgi:hypothetical protein
MIGKIFGTKEYIADRVEFINSLPISDDTKTKQINFMFSEYTAFKLMQRSIALIFSLIYVIAISLALSANAIGVDYKAIIAIIAAFNLGMIILAILGFYFSGGALDSLRKD